MKTSFALDAVHKVITAKGTQYNKISPDAAGAFQNNFCSTFSSNLMRLQYRKLCNYPSLSFLSLQKFLLKKHQVQSSKIFTDF